MQIGNQRGSRSSGISTLWTLAAVILWGAFTQEAHSQIYGGSSEGLSTPPSRRGQAAPPVEFDGISLRLRSLALVLGLAQHSVPQQLRPRAIRAIAAARGIAENCQVFAHKWPRVRSKVLARMEKSVRIFYSAPNENSHEYGPTCGSTPAFEIPNTNRPISLGAIWINFDTLKESGACGNGAAFSFFHEYIHLALPSLSEEKVTEMEESCFSEGTANKPNP